MIPFYRMPVSPSIASAISKSIPNIKNMIARVLLLVLLCGVAGKGWGQTLFNANTAMTTAGNYNPSGLPNNTTDVQITTSSTGLVISSANITMRSFSITNGTSYSLTNASTGATNRSLILGNTSAFTNPVSSISNDIFYTNNSTLNFSGSNSSTGSAITSLTLASSGNFNVNGTGGLTIGPSAFISGAFGITKTGSGNLTLSAANTYTGGLALTTGTLNINNATALGTTAGTFTINGGTINNTSGSAITTSNYPQTWAGNFTFTGTNSLNLGTGAVSLSANRQVTASASTLTVGGIISGAFGLTKAGNGTLLLSGANTYSGTTTISTGTLQCGAANTIPTASAVVLANTSGVIFNLNNFSQTIGSLAGGGGSGGNVSLGTASLTTGADNTNTSYGGVISGTGGLTKAGTGILLLSGVNTYTGTTSVNAGELRLNPSGNISLSGACTFNTGTLATTGITASRTITFGSINVSDNSTLALDASNAHTLTFTALGTLTSGKILTITGWTGTSSSYATGTTGTKGQVFIGNSASLTAAQLSQIRFYDGVSYYYATQLSTGEIVPTTALTISAISNQTAGVSFSVTVTATDMGGVARNLTNATGITLTSTNTISGTTTGSIAAAGNTVTISGVILTAGTNATITATRSSGDQPLAGTSGTFDVAVAATSSYSGVTAGAGAEPLTISSLVNTLAASSLNFDFKVTDDANIASGNDALPTLINQIVITQGTGNDVTVWTQAILGAELSDGITTQTGTIGASSITFSSIPTATLGNIADGAAKTYTLKIWLNTTMGGTLANFIDHYNLAFKIDRTNFTTATVATSTQFESLPGTAVESGATNNEVTVVKTALNFSTQPAPTTINVNTNFSTAAVITAQDANGNTDLDFTESITAVSNSQGFTTTNPPAVGNTFGSGAYTFPSNFQFLSGGATPTVIKIETVTFSGGNSAFSTGITVNIAPPVVTTTAITGITNAAAASGGNVTADGGAAVDAKGVVWAVFAAVPTMPSVSSTTDGSGLGSFTSAPALAPETHYNLRAYAHNAAGYGYGATQSFYTFSNPPLTQAANLVANTNGANEIDLTWDAATYPSSGATVKGYFLVRSNGTLGAAGIAPTPTFTAANGTAPTAGVGTIVGPVLDPSAIYLNTGLNQNTTYNYLLIPYTWDGTNAATYNYLTALAATATAITDVGACTPPTQASSVVFGTVTASSIVINWTKGAGSDASLVIVRPGSSVTAVPAVGNAYNADPNYGSGDYLGSLQYVVYNGTGSSFTLTNLTAATTYFVTVYSFNNSGYCYNLASPATGSKATIAAPAIIETFEPNNKAAYTSGTVICNLGSWNFNNALINNSDPNDRKIGTRPARIQSTGSITMLFDKANGLGTVTIHHALYGSDVNSTWRMEVSDDNGATFNAYTSPIQTTSSTNINSSTATLTANVPGDNIRIRITKLSGNRLNIDDISLGDYISTNTLATGVIAGSPFCISNTAGIAVSVPFTSSGVFASDNVYTAQLSDETGNFAAATDIGSLASVALSGTIAATIPAGTLTGSAYRIKVVSSSPVLIGTQNSSALIVQLNAPDVTNFNGTVASSTSVNLGWILPVSCYDEIMIVGSTSTITVMPSGNGTAYTASAAYSGGASNSGLPANNYTVYKGTGSAVSVTGLTTATLYYFKVFGRKGTTWSPGILISITATPDITGDFRSKGSGNYSSTSVWEMYNGSMWVAASIYPNQGASAGTAGTVNVTIQSGTTIVLDVSRTSQAIKNLTIQSGGKIWANDSSVNGNRYLTVYGDIFCAGTIGSNVTNAYDNISFNFDGINQTISGIGSFNASRIRKNYSTNATTNLLISMNLGLKFNAGTLGASGTEIYNNSASAGTFNMTVNANTIVDLKVATGTSGNVSITSTSGETLIEHGGTFTINGTLNVPGTLFAFTANKTLPIKYVIGNTGVINCVNVCTANAAAPTTNYNVTNGSETGGCTFQILNGGRLNMTGGSSADLNTYNKPFSIRNNTISPFEYVAGLGTVNNMYDFQPGSTVEYSSGTGTMPVQSATLVYSNLKISGGATSTITSALTVNKDLTIESPSRFDCQNQIINLGGDWNNYATAGFDEGTGTVLFNGYSASGSVKQHIYCPGGENFYNVQVRNSYGLELNCDAEIANTLDLGSGATANSGTTPGSFGQLYFGNTPSLLALTNMTNTSVCFTGSGNALVDMSAATHSLRLGSEFPSYSGLFTAGTTSSVNYNRSDILSGSSGNQNVLTGINYANLYLSGSNTKNTAASFTVNADLVIDGASTSLEATAASKVLTLAGNLTLSGGGTMGGATGTSCLSNLSLLTSGNAVQTFSGDFNPANFYNVNTTKTAGGITLFDPATFSTLSAKNDINIVYSGTAAMVPNSNNINVGNNWNNSGSAYFTEGTASTVTFNGTGDQILTCPGGEAFANFTMNNSGTGKGLTLNNILFAAGTGTFTAGILKNTSVNLLTMGVNAATAGGNSTSYVNGPMAKQVAIGGTTEFLFPVGKTGATPTAYNPAGVVPVNITGAVTTFTAEYFTGTNQAQGVMGPDLAGIVNNGYWDIDKAPVNAANTARVKLNYNDPGTTNWVYYNTSATAPYHDPAVAPLPGFSVAVVHRDATTTWSFTGSSGTYNTTDPESRDYTDPGFIYSKALSSFSPFSLGYGYSFILPVRLLSFTGRLVVADGRLDWKVADAKDLAGFRLEYSTDGHTYKKLADVEANGGTAYSYLDPSLPEGAVYYRLLIKDKSGSSYYSQIVILKVGKLLTYLVGVSPTVVDAQIVPVVFSARKQVLEAMITDVLGRKITAIKTQLEPGSNQWRINTQSLAKGMYFLTLHTEDGLKVTKRFIKE